MTYSKGSVAVVGDQRAHSSLAGMVVMPDRGGQAQDALQHPGDYPARGVPAMAFQIQLAFEGVVD